jgi:UDP-N-acetylglucosamine--N-acetylmuramyl-(pentapeptide) pyrophosphoryl-undecaprenol N-acetylglucosamine transferase
MSKPWFVIAGGGTGGHLYPGLVVAEAMKAARPDIEITLFGTKRPIDEQLAAARNIALVKQEVLPLPRKITQWLTFLKAWRRSVKFAREQFAKRAPAVVLGLGGYAAGPPIVAASKLKIPTAIFNPDAVPGRANKKLAPMVDRVFVQWDQTRAHFPKARDVKRTGCPIREAFGQMNKDAAIRALKLNGDRKVILITGASQGAQSINAAMLELIDLWKNSPDWQLIHLTGKNDLEICANRYRAAGVDAKTIGYTEHMAHCMAAADLIISRAGASTLAEITAVGVPAILMPYPYDKHKHQLANAKVLADAHAAQIVEDSTDAGDNAQRLRPALESLMKGDERRRRMSKASAALGAINAVETMTQELLELAGL